jgi:hypothetical protein
MRAAEKEVPAPLAHCLSKDLPDPSIFTPSIAKEDGRLHRHQMGFLSLVGTARSGRSFSEQRQILREASQAGACRGRYTEV